MLIIYFLGLAYMFLCCAILTEEFFVPSLEKLAIKWKMSPDVAGATLMAVGSSAPEIFVNVIDTVFGEEDLGLDSVIGSAMFNICIITSLSAICAPKPLQLNWKPFIRDFIFYFITVLLLVISLADGKVFWYESVCFLILYLFYVITLMNNDACFACLGSTRVSICPSHANQVSIEFMELEIEDGAPETSPLTLRHSGYTACPPVSELQTHDPSEPVNADHGDDLHDGSDIPMQVERQGWQQTFVYLVEPIKHIFRATIPEQFPFVGSCVWILFISYTLIQLTKLSGCTLDVPLSIMGIILLAGGTSIPDLLASIFVSKQMKGDMAISNISGSNISNALIGLGLPWTIQTIFVGDHEPTTENLEYFMAFLFFSLFLSLFIFVCHGFVLDRIVGFILIALYFFWCGFVVFVVEDV